MPAINVGVRVEIFWSIRPFRLSFLPQVINGEREGGDEQNVF